MSASRRPAGRRSLRVAFPIYCSGSAIPACILAVCDRLQGADFGVEYWAPAVEPAVQRPYHRVPLPRLATRLWYRLGLAETGLRDLLERRYLAAVRPGDIAYLWPALSLEFFERLAERGIPIVLERVNSHRRNSMRVLDEAYRRLGLPANHGITMRDADIESRKLALATRVFCPSPLVHRSLLEQGVPEHKLFHTSYAWESHDFQVHRTPRGAGHVPQFLFVANGTVRKGLAQLLDYWAAAGLRARLRIVGPIEPALRERCARELARPDVEHLPYRKRLDDLYGEADVFVLPSHEEGSPLVTYLALGAGLPCLVSPAGAGGVVADRVHGLVRDPYDEVGWISALRELAGDPDLRTRLGAAAREQAERYTWDQVGARRRAEFERLFAGG